MKSKIHGATVTEANVEYMGSITIDKALLEKADLTEGEKVQVLDMDSGERLDTYIMQGKRNSGTICMNGPAARLIKKGDRVIIVSYCIVDERERKNLRPRVVFVDGKNKFVRLNM